MSSSPGTLKRAASGGIVRPPAIVPIATRAGPRKLVVSLLLALLSGLLLLAASPGFDLSLCAWVALVPLLLAIGEARPRGAFVLSWLAGAVFFRLHFYWINASVSVAWHEALLLNAYLGVYVAIFGLALSFVARTTRCPLLLSAPVLWVATEYLRSSAGFLALPWGLLAHSQYRNLPLVQVSAVTGAYGLSFLIVMVNALLAEFVMAWWGARARPAPWRRLAVQATIAAALVLAAVGWGLGVMAEPLPTRTVPITVIQGNIDQRERWEPALMARNLERHIGLTKASGTGRERSLVVWPETAVQSILTEDLQLASRLGSLARETGSRLLVGSAARPKVGPSEVKRKRFHNSAFLFSANGGLAGQYDKILLLPFAEYLPYKEVLPWPSSLRQRASNFVAGDQPAVLGVAGARFGVLICWENIFPGLVRQSVLRGAEFIVNITNEAWFGQTAAPYQFLAMAVFRAVENRRGIARSANTGISGFIDPHGRILATVKDGDREIFVAGAVTERLPLVRELTFYTRFGDVFSQSLLAFGALLVASAGLRPYVARVRTAPSGSHE